MPKTASARIAVIGIDIGKYSFHVVGHDSRDAIVLRQKWSRGQIEVRHGAAGLKDPYKRTYCLSR